MTRTERAIERMADYAMVAMSPDGQKMLSLKPDTQIILKREPTVRLNVIVVARTSAAPHLATLDVAFPTGIRMTFTTGVDLVILDPDHQVSLDEIIIVTNPSLDDIVWCDKNKIQL